MDNGGTRSLPSLSATVTLEPQVLRSTDTASPILSVMVTLIGSSKPITICTWDAILEPKVTQLREGFDIIDKATRDLVPINSSSCMKRRPFGRQLGTSDERHWVTLIPQAPYTVQTLFIFKARSTTEISQPAALGVTRLGKGNYALRISPCRNKVVWWRYGTKEDNFESPGRTHLLFLESEQPSPLMIDADAVPLIDFEVP